MADLVLQSGDNNPSVVEAQDLLNRNGALLDTDGSFGGGTEAAVREFQAAQNLDVTGVIDASTWQSLRALPEPSPDIPTSIVAFIGQEEVGSCAEYETECSRPAWPGVESGVTIGVGYDLGQESGFEADWSDVLTPDQMSALTPWVGIRGEAAKPGVAALAGITIPWNAAWTAFIRRSLPDYISETRNAFAGWDRLPKLCFGVLVDLVYNRGAGMTDSPPGSGNRQEMRDIRDAVASGQFQTIPASLRAMKRLWPNAPGLQGRRDREAALFEEGLAQQSSASQTA